MKLVFLGTTGYHPNNRRHTPAILFPEIGLVLDAGSGLFRARDLMETDQLHIFLSHIHLDHCVGLTFLFDIGFGRDLAPTQVYVESAKQVVLEQHLFHQLLFPARLPIEYRPIQKGCSRFELPGETVVRTFPLQHPGGSLGFVVEQHGKRVAYVTDTIARSDAEYLEHIRDVDLLIHECYFPDGCEEHADLTGHSCATPVAEVARECNVKELLLVHVNPLDESDDPIGMETIRSIFPKARIAEDLEEVVV